MKLHIHAVAVTLLLSASGLAHADYRLVPTDDSPLTRICVAALSSESELKAAAAAADINRMELDTVLCNGSTIAAFVKKYGSHSPSHPKPEAYAFNSTNDMPETRLCLAAVTSPTEFRKLKNELFDNLDNVEEEVLCNGMPLKRFALKYARSGLSVSQR